jgi:dihydroneopterin aldolase
VGDDLDKTVNYADLAQQLHAVLVGEPVNLLETLAQRLANVCLAQPLVDAVEITVHKPQAELGVPFDDVTVTVLRQRKDPLLPTARELAAGPGSGPRSE